MIKTTRYRYNFINPTIETNPLWAATPAFRGENQLNIYTREYIHKTKNNGTGTNPWGYEAAVDKNGIVIKVLDRVTIPKDGFVISGNQIGSSFIKKNIFLGSKITIDQPRQEIIIETNTIKSICLSLKEKRKEFLKRYKKAKENAYIINERQIKNTKNKVENIIKYIKKASKNHDANEKKIKQLEQKAVLLFDKLYLLTSPSFAISSRNAWVRPFEQSLDEIINTLEICKKCNINGLYVESFYNGDIPGSSCITNTSAEVANGYYGEQYKNDYLKALISEAHKRDIEIHAWVECFFVGEKSNQWKKWYKESWHMVNYDGSFVQGNNDHHLEKDFIWLDPANPECLNYVLSIYKELLTNYEFDGINVDYVRYPYGNAELWSSNGYSAYAIDEFLKENHLSGDIKELLKNKDIHELWVKYRCGKITNLMKEVRKLVKNIRPNCYISTAVCSDLNYAIYNKMQNWKVWARKGWLDLTLPMAYYYGCSEIANATKELVDFNKEKAFSYTGILGIQPGEPIDLVIHQINTLFENNADGYAIFQLRDILNSKQLQRLLKMSVNRTKSVHPHCDGKLLIKTYIKDLRKRKSLFKNDIQYIINSFKNINDFSIDHLIDKIHSLYQSYKHDIQIKKELKHIIHFLKIQKSIKNS